jgi:uncharacterized OB-fold protein
MTFYEKQTDPSSPMHWLGDMQADYLYPNGKAGDKLFKHIKENDTFLASKCINCSKIFFPPRLYCEDCFVEILEKEWFETPSTGKIRLHTIVTINTYGEKLNEPKMIALIDIDNTDGALLGIIKTDNIDGNLIGRKVEAVFKSKNQREGTLKDILYFKMR